MEEAKQILASDREYNKIECLHIFSKTFEQNLCVDYHLSRNRNICCHFIAIREDKEFIHSHLENTHFTIYIKIIYPQEMNNNKTNSSVTCEDSYENTSDEKKHIANNTARQEGVH
jgi:quinol monooxygenase YgiN